MSFSATCKAGLVPYRMHHAGDRVLVPGDPGVTFTKNKLYTMVGGGGVAIELTDSVGQGLLRCVKTKTAAAATVAFPTRSDNIREYKDSADADTLISFEFMAPDQMIYAARISGYVDETVASYTASTRAVAMTTGFDTDNYPNGALACVYDGPGKGELNVVESYDHSGGAAALLTVFHRAFSATLTSDSKIIVLNPAAAAQAVSFLDSMDALDADDLDTADGVDNGDYLVYPDWRLVKELLPTGALPVIRNTNHVWA